jgi:hypothetical protein
MVRWRSLVVDEIHWAGSSFYWARISAAVSITRADDLGQPVHRRFAGEPEADFLLARLRVLLQKRIGGDQHARRADARRAAISRNFCGGCSLSPCAMPSWSDRGLALRREASGEQIRRSSGVVNRRRNHRKAQPLGAGERQRPAASRRALSSGSHRNSIGSPLMDVVT